MEASPEEAVAGEPELVLDLDERLEARAVGEQRRDVHVVLAQDGRHPVVDAPPLGPAAAALPRRRVAGGGHGGVEHGRGAGGRVFRSFPLFSVSERELLGVGWREEETTVGFWVLIKRIKMLFVSPSLLSDAGLQRGRNLG